LNVIDITQSYVVLRLSLSISDAAHEKVPNGENGVISTVVWKTCQGIKQNKNQ